MKNVQMTVSKDSKTLTIVVDLTITEEGFAVRSQDEEN